MTEKEEWNGGAYWNSRSTVVLLVNQSQCCGLGWELTRRNAHVLTEPFRCSLSSFQRRRTRQRWAGRCRSSPRTSTTRSSTSLVNRIVSICGRDAVRPERMQGRRPTVIAVVASADGLLDTRVVAAQVLDAIRAVARAEAGRVLRVQRGGGLGRVDVLEAVDIGVVAAERINVVLGGLEENAKRENAERASRTMQLASALKSYVVVARRRSSIGSMKSVFVGGDVSVAVVASVASTVGASMCILGVVSRPLCWEIKRLERQQAAQEASKRNKSQREEERQVGAPGRQQRLAYYIRKRKYALPEIKPRPRGASLKLVRVLLYSSGAPFCLGPDSVEKGAARARLCPASVSPFHRFAGCAPSFSAASAVCAGGLLCCSFPRESIPVSSSLASYWRQIRASISRPTGSERCSVPALPSSACLTHLCIVVSGHSRHSGRCMARNGSCLIQRKKCVLIVGKNL